MMDNQMTKRTMNTDATLGKVVCSCGKVCKNIRGLKIHQGRMKCSQVLQPEQRTVPKTTGETGRNHSPEANHRAENPNVMTEIQNAPKATTRKVIVKWPAMSSKEWKSFEEDVDKILETVLIGSVEKKLWFCPLLQI